jgi:hypothetical protein
LDVYLWLEEMFHVLAHVLRESRFEELHNVGVHDERGFPKVAKEFMATPTFPMQQQILQRPMNCTLQKHEPSTHQFSKIKCIE